MYFHFEFVLTKFIFCHRGWYNDDYQQLLSSSFFFCMCVLKILCFTFQVLRNELGPDFRSGFHAFIWSPPLAAASIGQVHQATIILSPDGNEILNNDHEIHEEGKRDGEGEERELDLEAEGEEVAVAVKIQYPGVAESIDSDVANLRMLSQVRLIPVDDWFFFMFVCLFVCRV